MDFTADLPLFFSDFVEPITIDGQPVKALVDVDLATAFGIVGGFSMAVQVPAGTVVARGSLVVARGSSYKVARKPHDSHGVLTLELTAA